MIEIPYKLSDETAAELQRRSELARQLLKMHGRSSAGPENLFAPLPEIRRTLSETLAAGPGSACEPQHFIRERAAKMIQEITSVLAQWPPDANPEAFAGRPLSCDELRLAEKTLVLRSRFEELRRLISLPPTPREPPQT